MKQINKFHEISIELTGFNNLSSNLIEAYYYKIMKEKGYSENLSKLIDELINNHTPLKELTETNRSYKRLVKGIVFLWYTSELISWESIEKWESTPVEDRKFEILERKTGTQEEYYEGLIWKAIRAHPLGLSGGYFGHWKYEPEN